MNPRSGSWPDLVKQGGLEVLPHFPVRRRVGKPAPSLGASFCISHIEVPVLSTSPNVPKSHKVVAMFGEVTLAILPGTWIKRGDRLVLIDELGVGNYIMAQAAPLPEGASRPGTVGSSIGERAITVEQANIP
jgi:hypothetical protein